MGLLTIPASCTVYPYGYSIDTLMGIMLIPLRYNDDTLILIPQGIKFKPKPGYPLGYHHNTLFLTVYSDHSRWSWQSGIQANSSCCIKISTSQFHAQNVVAFSARHKKFKLFLVMLKHLHKVLAFNNYVFCLFTDFTVNFRSKTMSVPCIVLRLIL